MLIIRDYSIRNEAGSQTESTPTHAPVMQAGRPLPLSLPRRPSRMYEYKFRPVLAGPR